MDLPDILIIQLSRFKYVNNKLIKNNSLVKFPIRDLELLVNDIEVSVKLKYSLRATINHSGNMQKDQYKAVVKNSSEEWLICNDSAVIPVKSEEVELRTSYVLIYASQ